MRDRAKAFCVPSPTLLLWSVLCKPRNTALCKPLNTALCKALNTYASVVVRSLFIHLVFLYMFIMPLFLVFVTLCVCVCVRERECVCGWVSSLFAAVFCYELIGKRERGSVFASSVCMVRARGVRREHAVCALHGAVCALRCAHCVGVLQGLGFDGRTGCTWV